MFFAPTAWFSRLRQYGRGADEGNHCRKPLAEGTHHRIGRLDATAFPLDTELGIATTPDNRQVVTRSDMIVVATKPAQVPEVLSEVADVVTVDKLIVSIARASRWQRSSRG